MPLRIDLLKAGVAVLGRMACAALAPFSRRVSDSEAHPEQVLVIRPGGIGDAVLFIPMLEELKREWPDAHVDLLLERRNLGVLPNTNLFREALCYDKPTDLLRAMRRGYDVVIDTEQFHRLSAVVSRLTGASRRIGFDTNSRRWLLTDRVAYDEQRYEVLCFLDLSQRATGRSGQWTPEDTFYPIDAEAARRAAEMLEPLAHRPLVALMPGASIPQRRWPAERYGQVAKLLVERSGAGVVLLGGREDRKTANEIAKSTGASAVLDLVGRTSLAETAAVVERCDVYLSADTGVLHLAYGVGTPTVHLFGPGVHSKWGPVGERFHSVARETPCSPCTRYGYTPPCNQGLVCMLGIEPQSVFDAVDQLLREIRTAAFVEGETG